MERYFANLTASILQISPRQMQRYLVVAAIEAATSLIPGLCGDEMFGCQADKAEWQGQCVAKLQQSVRPLATRFYVEELFPPSHKEHAERAWLLFVSVLKSRNWKEPKARNWKELKTIKKNWKPNS